MGSDAVPGQIPRPMGKGESVVFSVLLPDTGQGGLETQTPFLGLTESHACGILQVLHYASCGVTHPVTTMSSPPSQKGQFEGT